MSDVITIEFLDDNGTPVYITNNKVSLYKPDNRSSYDELYQNSSFSSHETLTLNGSVENIDDYIRDINLPYNIKIIKKTHDGKSTKTYTLYKGKIVLHSFNDEPAIDNLRGNETQKVWYKLDYIHRDNNKPARTIGDTYKAYYECGKLLKMVKLDLVTYTF